MDILLFFKGILIGVLMSFPFGPMGLLCIHRTLNNGRVSGFLSGMGVATADTFFAIIAGFGVSFIVHFLEAGQFYFHLFGSIIILLLGLRIFLSNPVKKFRYRNLDDKRRIWHYFSGFFLTLTNPFTLFAFLAVFTTLNLFDRDSFAPALTIIIGIFAGSSTWWFLISSVVNKLRDRIRLRGIFWMNKIAGAAIFLFGFIAILGFLIAG